MQSVKKKKNNERISVEMFEIKFINANDRLPLANKYPVGFELNLLKSNELKFQ